MPKHQEKTIDDLPCELILKIFLDKSLGIKENVVISLVCKFWNNLSSDNTVWRALFLRNFSWSPTLFYTDSSPKEIYKQQLSLNFSFEKKCKPTHQCAMEPGLMEAILDNNLPLLEALLHSGHGICIRDHEQPINEFFDKCLYVLSESTHLPPRLLIKIFENGIVDEDMDRYGINLFHILCLKGDPYLLERMFTLLGDDLPRMSHFCDSDGVDLFSHLLDYPFYQGNPNAYADDEEKNRLDLVLETFDKVLGKTKMRSLLTFSPYIGSFIHVLANSINRPDVNQHFFKAFSYLEKEDYWILLKEGSSYFDIPLFNLIHCPKSFKQLVQSLGDDAPRFLKHKNCYGYNFLYFLLLSSQFACIPLLEEVMGQDFSHLLVEESSNRNMLKKILGSEVTGVKNMIIQSLKLMKKYDGMDIIRELYESSEFLRIVNKNSRINANEISDIFNEHLEKKTFGCTLL